MGRDRIARHRGRGAAEADRDAAGVILRLGLRPLPGEGGWYRETWRAAGSVPAGPSGEPRSPGTAILYLVTAASGSAMHRLRIDEVWHHYAGCPVDLLLLHPDGTGRVVVLGPDVAGGQVPQAVVPAGTWQGARVAGRTGWALLGTTTVPGFDAADWEAGDAAILSAGWPSLAREVHARCPVSPPAADPTGR